MKKVLVLLIAVVVVITLVMLVKPKQVQVVSTGLADDTPSEEIMTTGADEPWTYEALSIDIPEELLKDNEEWTDLSMVIYNPQSNEVRVFNEAQAWEQLSPCSTYKIPHSLMALDAGIVEDENSTYEWDGKEYYIESWNRDHTLKSAVQNSVVWYFKRLAKAIGPEKTKAYLNDIDYGNKDISGGQEKYWLKSSLKISAVEQLEILEGLYNEELPFSAEHQRIVKDIILLDEHVGKKLSGKTGSGKELGWFIGYVSTSDDVTYFSVNMKNHAKASGSTAKAICLDILSSEGIY